MKRFLLLAGILAAVLAASPAAAQITRGADQPNQNKWNAKGPWGKTERSAPIEAQRKKPFKVFDNVWYVGFQTVSVYLVSTSDGLVLIDAGYAQTVDWLLENIRAAGFDPANVKYIFVTHSHVDHASGAARMKQATGARVGLSAEDWGSVEQQQSSAPWKFSRSNPARPGAEGQRLDCRRRHDVQVLLHAGPHRRLDLDRISGSPHGAHVSRPHARRARASLRPRLGTDVQEEHRAAAVAGAMGRRARQPPVSLADRPGGRRAAAGLAPRDASSRPRSCARSRHSSTRS